MTALVEARNLSHHYEVSKGAFQDKALVRALDGVSFTLNPGQTLAVVGESGCGKSTLARQITMIERPTGGELTLDGIDLVNASRDEVAAARRKIQMIFQDPYGSLNPRKKVGTIVGEPLAINSDISAEEREQRVRAVLEKVGLRPEHYGRYPHMFSGGQRQRIAVARALMLESKLVVADEPVSALDVSVQAQVLNLLMDLQEEMNLAYIFISHDLSVVRHISDDVMVMYLGRIVESGPSAEIFANPRHPYTKALLASTSALDEERRRERIVLKGELPSPLDPPAGCAFQTRCPHATDACQHRRPELEQVENRLIACDRLAEIEG